VPALAALAQRIEAAVAALTDPAELDERLETTRAAVARQVADAQAQAAAGAGQIVVELRGRQRSGGVHLRLTKGARPRRPRRHRRRL